jgi:hypothetical protein
MYGPAFSANFLLPLYPAPASPFNTSSQDMGFQSSAVYTFPASAGIDTSTHAAKLLVVTTLFTLGANFLVAFKISVVPFTAGVRNSIFDFTALYRNGLAVWMTVSNSLGELAKTLSDVGDDGEVNTRGLGAGEVAEDGVGFGLGAHDGADGGLRIVGEEGSDDVGADEAVGAG